MNAKKIILVILFALLLIFIIQNTEATGVNVFFWKIEMPKIVIIALTGLIGISIGWLLGSITQKNKRN